MNEDEKNNAPSQPNNDDANKDPEKKDSSDNLTPEHPRFKEVVAEKNELKATVADLQTQLEEVKNSISQRQTSQNDDELTPEEEATLSRIEKGLKAKGSFVSAEDLRVSQRANIYSSLEKTHDGKDDLPKFDKAKVVAYAKENGFDSDSERGLESAYRDMHFDALVQKASKGKGPTPPDSEKPTGSDRKIPDIEMTPEQIAMMDDSEYEKNRSKILAAIKPKRVITP